MKYPKIDTIWKRDEKNKFRIIEGDYSNEEFKNVKMWDITEKIDGTNIRIFFNRDYEVTFGGRTDNAQTPTFLLEYLQKKFTSELLKPVFDRFHDRVILFGEGYGARIQKGGGLYRQDVSFILFDVWIDGWWLEQEKVGDIAKSLGIMKVPYIKIMTIEEAVEYIKNKPKSVLAKEEKDMKGIVARSHPLMLFRNGNPMMWKLKVKDYEKLEKK